MKNLKAILFWSLLAMTCFNTTIAKPGTTNSVVVYANPFSEDVRLKDYEVKVYDGNSLVMNFFVPNTKGFSVSLDQEKSYTIEISKEGFFEKRIAINTLIYGTQKFQYEIAFDAEVVAKDNPFVDPYYLDFPASIIRFNSDEACFEVNEKYTTFIQNMQTRGAFVSNLD